MIDITFFVPCLNEEKNIVPTIETILAAINKINISYEILIVDDNSSDQTVKIVKNFQETHTEACVTLKCNESTLGLGRNYVDGAYIGKGKYYMLVNGDNAEPKETIISIIEKLGTADMIIPYFGLSDSRSTIRNLVSRMFTRLVNWTSGYSLTYYNGPVAHLRYNVMRWHADTHGFAYQAEIITRVLDEGGTYVEVQTKNFDRRQGLSKAFTIQNVMSVSHSLLQICLRRFRNELFYRTRKGRTLKKP